MFNADFLIGSGIFLVYICVFGIRYEFVDLVANLVSRGVRIGEDDDACGLCRMEDPFLCLFVQGCTAGFNRFTVKVFLQDSGIVTSFHNDDFPDLTHHSLQGSGCNSRR